MNRQNDGIHKGTSVVGDEYDGPGRWNVLKTLYLNRSKVTSYRQ